MVKRVIELTCAVALGLSLVACGPAPAPQGEAQQGHTEATSTAAAQGYEGEWHLAALTEDGATLVGNFTQFYGMEKGNTITVSADGTATITNGDEKTDLTWKLADDGTATFEDVEKTDTALARLDGNALVLSAEDGTIELTYTTDGVYPGELPDVEEDGTAIASADELVGTWHIYATQNKDYSGHFAFGEAGGLAEMGEFDSGELVFEEDGTGTMLGYDIAWNAGADGASLTVADTGVEVPVLKTADGLLCKSTVDGNLYWFKK